VPQTGKTAVDTREFLDADVLFGVGEVVRDLELL
jgi:hypothetical protein